MENKEETYSIKDLSRFFKSFVQLILRKIPVLLIAILIGAGIGFIYYLFQKPKYEAVTSFILEEKAGAGGGLAGIASQFGFNLGSLTGGGSIFGGDNILNILKSKKVIKEVLLTKISDSSSSDKTLADHYIEFSKLNKRLSKKKEVKGINFYNVNEKLSPLQDSVLDVIYEDIIEKNLLIEKKSKQGTIITVKFTASNSLFAQFMARRLVEEASRLYLEIKVGTEQENIRSLQRRSDSLLMLLNNKSYAVAARQNLDLNPGIRTGNVPVEIATRDKTVLATLYAEVTKNLEASKLLYSQRTPVIQLLDEPGYLLDDQKKGILFILIVSSFLGGFIFILISFLLYMFFGIGQNKKTYTISA